MAQRRGNRDEINVVQRRRHSGEVNRQNSFSDCLAPSLPSWYHLLRCTSSTNGTIMPPRFQRVRRSRLLRALKWLVTRLFFWAALLIVVVLNWSYSQLAPHIVSIPFVRQGGDVTIQGQHFGAQQSGSTLVFDVNDQSMVIEDIVSWSDTQIDVKLPVANSEGTVYVVRRIPLLSLASNVVAYVVQATGLPSAPYGYEVPVQDNSPWPLFRHDERNTANSPLPAV